MEFYYSLGSLKASKLGVKITRKIFYVNILLQILDLLKACNCKGQCVDEVKVPYLYIESKSLNRAFIVKSNSIVSFSFPLSIKVKDGSSSISIYLRDKELSSFHISLCKTFVEENIRKGNPKSIKEIMSDAENGSEEERTALELLEYLLVTEASYLRYDNDPTNSHSQGNVHPVHHFDVNFSPSTTYKIGLNRKIILHDLKKILLQNSSCWFLERPLTKKQFVYNVLMKKEKRNKIKHRLSSRKSNLHR